MRQWRSRASFCPDQISHGKSASISPHGMRERNDVLPDGQYLLPMGMSWAEWHMRDVLKQKFGRTLTLGRSANLTLPQNGRMQCHYCGPCERGCVTHSYFNSSFTTMKDALGTGKCEMITGAMAYKVLMDPASNRVSLARLLWLFDERFQPE
jgi:hypothetical protein